MIANVTKAGSGRILVAAIVSYMAFGLMTAVTEQLLSLVSTSIYATRLLAELVLKLSSAI